MKRKKKFFIKLIGRFANLKTVWNAQPQTHPIALDVSLDIIYITEIVFKVNNFFHFPSFSHF